MVFFGFLLLTPAQVGAQQVNLFGQACKNNNSKSSVCQDAKAGKNNNPLYGPRGIISRVVNLLSIVVGVAAVLGIIVAGIKFMTSASDPKGAGEARELVIYALIGLVIATLAQVLVKTVLYTIGVQ